MNANYKLILAAIITIFAAGFLNPAFASTDSVTESGAEQPSSSSDSDTLNYQADLFTGRFTYSIPIKVAPGRQGSEPKLALNYSSAVGNGWCGVGWTLEAGYIQRDTRRGVPLLFGPTNSLGIYDDSKGFVANSGGVSSRLVLIPEASNGATNVYRKQVEKGFLTYTFYKGDTNYWVVTDEGGNIFFFGDTDSCRMKNPNTNTLGYDCDFTYRWAISHVIDANGNSTVFNYLNDGGMLYLTNITYNANTNSPGLTGTHQINFLLAGRTDTNISYISGYRVTTGILLSEVDSYASGSNVSRYVLNYSNSSSTARSLLTSVTQYGSDFSTALPAIRFGYQVESFSFGPDTNWGPVVDMGGGASYSAMDAFIPGSSGGTHIVSEMIDMDGDGLPDHVIRTHAGPYSFFGVQRNIGNGFDPTVTNYVWSPLTSEGNNSDNSRGSIESYNSSEETGMYDINGDGYIDRVLINFSDIYTNWYVETNTGYAGTSGFSTDISWGMISNRETDTPQWKSPLYFNTPDQSGQVELIDMNGDGLPDIVSRKVTSPYDRFRVQLNTGNSFSPPVDWATLDSQGDTGAAWNAISAFDDGGQSSVVQNCFVMLADINGDGLPDRIMRSMSAPYTNFYVQYNNGAGFDPAEPWGPVNTQNDSGERWGSPNGVSFLGSDSSDQVTLATLVDINGDGLLDRVMMTVNSPYTNWYVQINNGHGFNAPVIWTGVDGQGNPTDPTINAISLRDVNSTEDAYGRTKVDFLDINGDGLPDRVMYAKNGSVTNYVVQLNQGPFPDLMNSVSNGIGGSVQIAYQASTGLDNRDKSWTNNPWTEGTRSLLPFNVWVVSNIVSSDGFSNNSTNTYAFKGGYYNPALREFRGFSQATVTDPYGTKTITYFQQGGGRDNSALGEYNDAGSYKMGIPFRTDTIGSDGTTNNIALNKVDEVMLDTNGWYFPFISQQVLINYEGLSMGRSTAKQFSYNTNTGNLLVESDLGEVTNVVFNGQTFTDIGNDSVYKWMSYASLGIILNRPSDIKITSDSAGANRLRESTMTYDSRGNLTTNSDWLDSVGAFITTGTFVYDQYGNQTQSTDAAGITTTTTYDSTFEQFPVSESIASFTSSFITDPRSGLILSATDAKGLVTSNTYDVFFRPTATYISTNSYGPATLWQSRTSYSLGGIISGISYNYVCNQVNDAVDPVNGFETYDYMDGLGRSVETRAEAETGQFRVQNSVYDLRGNSYFQTLSYFSSGSGYTPPSGTLLGSLTEYDDIGRAFRSTPSVNGTFNSSGQLTTTNATGGDVGSPVGQAITAFLDGGNPWAIVVTDSMGKSKKRYQDAYGRTVVITDVTTNGNYNTTYTYDLVGNLTNIMDSAGNSTVLTYDSLGRKTLMTDPDMGKWSYSYDDDGRLTQQIDANTNKLVLSYSDPLGRLVSKQIYNSSGALAGTVTFTYDTSDDPNYTVFPGQLYKVTDLQGYERSSYDVRGRVVKDTRYLNVNSLEYVTQATYDDADRVQQLTYPGNSATIKYAYDTANHLIQVRSLAGTGTQEIFYSAGTFNALDQLTSYTNGNGVTTAYTFFANSLRLQDLTTSFHGTNYQNLGYNYDRVSNVTNISDGVNTGTASAALSGVTYDDLYRLVSLNSTARGTKTYAYNALGNIVTNSDFGSGAYVYGAKPHAVVSANGISYGYDACGNMTTRGNQTLTYDCENQLSEVSTTNDTVSFGYDSDGERLWRAGTNGYSVWIGGIYEINDGKVLCHVIAGGQLICTFEPLCGGMWSKVMGEKNWYVASTTLENIFNWPFQDGRAGWTFFGASWACIFGTCLVAGRGIRFRSFEIRKTLRLSFLWRQAVSFTAISAFLGAGSVNASAAVTYSPVFYYYHPDHLGSSNVLTDRSGYIVQHYEYSTFGSLSYQNNTLAYPLSNRYTGQIADDETGLYYYGGRYYDPQLARFIQPDPTTPDPGDSQSFNRYSYCSNNPLNATDPSGYDPIGLGDADGYWGADIFDDAASDASTPTNFQLFQTPSPKLETVEEYEDNANNSDANGETGNGKPVQPGQDVSGVNYAGRTTEMFAAHYPSSQINDSVVPDTSVGNDPVVPGASSGNTGGGWVALTNAAELVSMLPIPDVAAVAGVLGAVGEAAQGNYGKAGLDLGMAALGLVGLGSAGKVAEEASVLGGAYRDVREANIGGEVHHMPAADVSTLSRGDGPAIWMETADHAQTASHGSQGLAGTGFRAQQATLINQGKFNEALQMDIRDIQSKFGSKYDVGIQQMLDYYKTIPPWKLELH